MENPDFPPNSQASKRGAKPIDEKDIRRVTTGETVRKKKSLRKRFTDSFVAGDLKTAMTYAVLDVLLPEAKDMVIETVHSGLERLLLGESRRYRGTTTPQSGRYGYVNYSGFSAAQRPSSFTSSQRAMSRQARARHDFDEILLSSRVEAEEVIDQLYNVVEKYDEATVADLMDLVGLASNHTDHKWGWTNIGGAGVTRTRDGYLLDLPEPEPLS